MNRVEKTLQQAQELVRAIEAVGTIWMSGPPERALVWPLLKAYRLGCEG